MKNLLLLAGMTVLGISAFAEDLPQPTVIENSNANAMSANARYIVADGYTGVKIFDLESGKNYDYTEGSPYGKYEAGFANCVSNNGIVVGYSESGTRYWKDGKWNKIKVPSNTTGSVLVNSITPDGSRICGSVGIASMSADNNDVLRQVPCIWNWNSTTNDFDTPILLPHPDRDFSGRVPQLITSVGISDDGKTAVGQVVTATGTVAYPIIYKENEAGEWSYTLPDYDTLYPEGVEFPEFPGEDGPTMPSEESFMTTSELRNYQAAFDAYVNSGYTIPAPEYKDYMTEEEYSAYEKAKAKYDVLAYDWSMRWNAWWKVFFEIISKLPDYEYNSIRLSPDGRTYANTVLVEVMDDPLSYGIAYTHIWVFDIESGDIKKYDQQNNFVLTYLANDGIALAVTDPQGASQSYVLKNGECINMQKWISNFVPEYGAWIDENMVEGVDVTIYNEETGESEIIFEEMVLTGRPSATPDLSVIALGVTNVWDFGDDGNTYIFDLKGYNSVATIIPSDEENTIYDLSGRKLKNANSPGIYIINGKKKVVR